MVYMPVAMACDVTADMQNYAKSWKRMETVSQNVFLFKHQSCQITSNFFEDILPLCDYWNLLHAYFEHLLDIVMWPIFSKKHFWITMGAFYYTKLFKMEQI